MPTPQTNKNTSSHVFVPLLYTDACKSEADAVGSLLTAYGFAVRKTDNQYVTGHSLAALARAGRLKSTSAFFGNLIGVKPILISDANGYQVASKKVKGRAKSLSEIAYLLKESIVSPEEQTIYLTHADCSAEEVEKLVSTIKSEIPCKEIEIGYIGPIIGASIGPDAIGIWAFGREITEGGDEG